MSFNNIFDKVSEKVRDLVSGDASGSDDPVAVPAVPGSLRIVLCNDCTSLHRRAEKVEEVLREKGHDISIKCVSHGRELLGYLKSLEGKSETPPDAFFLDVGGVGKNIALKVISWFDKNYPDKPLPSINFLSLDVSMGITEAGRLRESDGRLEAGFVDADELDWLAQHLEGKVARCRSVSTALREVLNTGLGTTFPLHQDSSQYANQIKNMMRVTNDHVLVSWQKGKLSADEAIERMRGYAGGLSAALRSGFYGQDGNAAAAEGLERAAQFYGSAGFPVKGPAVFSLADVKKIKCDSGEKPVLLMQSYDPEVVPLLASGRLGGLVVTSSYMASHLKLLCETHMVSGLFGLIPDGEKSLTREFNEVTQPELPPYFEGETAQIGGHALQKGQKVLVGFCGDGIALNPPDALKTEQVSLWNVQDNEKLRRDVANLRMINNCFASFFTQKGQAAHGVKVNIESANYYVLDNIEGIGLVRTEQMTASSGSQMKALKEILLHDNSNAHAYAALFDGAAYNYYAVIKKLNDSPVKIRLFDFVHAEILNSEEQEQFIARHGRLDIHGGDALAAWPQLYRDQVKTIFDVLENVSHHADIPLEIMMPAVRTEKDVLDIKKIIDEEALKLGISPSRYSFGVMTETLQACENISAIAKHCDFISFGTNDLTQEFFTMQRSDLKAHANFAAKNGYDPFKKLAPEILSLIETVTVKGREANPALKVDVCGAQAADLDTAVALFKAGIDNISVAPSIGNLYGLPALINYRIYDSLRKQEPTCKVQDICP